MARAIIESNRYMVLGTADEDGVPNPHPHLAGMWKRLARGMRSG